MATEPSEYPILLYSPPAYLEETVNLSVFERKSDHPSEIFDWDGFCIKAEQKQIKKWTANIMALIRMVLIE